MRCFHRGMTVWREPCLHNTLLPRQDVAKITKAAQQHPRFPHCPQLEYWSGPTMLNFAVRMGCGVFIVVWPFDGCMASNSVMCSQNYLKKKKTFFFFVFVFLFWLKGLFSILEPFIFLSHQPSMFFSGCWSLPKFDSKILIALKTFLTRVRVPGVEKVLWAWGVVVRGVTTDSRYIYIFFFFDDVTLFLSPAAPGSTARPGPR